MILQASYCISIGVSTQIILRPAMRDTARVINMEDEPIRDTVQKKSCDLLWFVLLFFAFTFPSLSISGNYYVYLRGASSSSPIPRAFHHGRLHPTDELVIRNIDYSFLNIG